jgi:hypothetical protein
MKRKYSAGTEITAIDLNVDLSVDPDGPNQCQ